MKFLYVEYEGLHLMCKIVEFMVIG